MSRVQYAGPKVEISNHGVKYNKSKEDKYIYLMVALEILKILTMIMKKDHPIVIILRILH